MKRKKVLIDLCSLENPNCGFGQIAVNYAKLFAEVQRSGNEPFDIVFLLPYIFKKQHYDLSEFEGVQCFYETTKLHHIFNIIPNRLPKVDLWHSVNQLVRRFPQMSSAKYIFTIHDYNFLFEEIEENKSKYLALMQQHIDRADAVTFISHYTEKIVSEYSRLDGKLTRTIYNGVESLRHVPQHQPAFVIEGQPFFFAIGQFLPKKKFDVLLDMMKYLPDRQLYICGQNDFPFGQELTSRIHNERLDNVHAPGSISNEERAWLFAHCEAYLFPSIGEGFGLPAIEAMQFGKPVFASNYQSLPEIVGDYGYVWPTLEPIDMARMVREGLSDFYADPDVSSRVMAYANSFSYERHIREYLQLYHQLLDI